MNQKLTETDALTIAIEQWIANNEDLVKLAQDLAKVTIHLGLVDTSTTLPFQIFPKNTYNAKGLPYCDLFLNVDHAARGFYTIQIEPDKFTVNPPSVFEDEATVYTKIEDVIPFLEMLAKDLDQMYELLGFIEKNDEQNANQKINELLSLYQNAIKDELENIKKYVTSIENIVIAAPGTNSFDFVKNAVHNFNQALLHPSNWFVLDDKPEKGEPYEDYVNDDLSNVLFEKISEFFKFESKHSVYMYLAQKIVSDAGWSGRIYSETTESWKEITRGENGMVYTIPVIDASKIEITKTYKKKK